MPHKEENKMAIKTRYSLTTENIQPSGRALKFVEMFAESRWKLWEMAIEEVKLRAKTGQISTAEAQKLYREQMGSINRQIEDVNGLIMKVQNDEIKAQDAIALKNVGKKVTTEKPAGWAGGGSVGGGGGSVTYGNAGKLPPDIQAQVDNVERLGSQEREDIMGNTSTALTQTQVRDGIARIMEDNAERIKVFQETPTSRSSRGRGSRGRGGAGEMMTSTTITEPIAGTVPADRTDYLTKLGEERDRLLAERTGLGSMPTGRGAGGGIGSQGLIEEARDVYSQRFGGGTYYQNKQSINALGRLHDDFYNRELAKLAPDPTNTELQAARERAAINVNNFLNDELFPKPSEPEMVPSPTGVWGEPKVPAVRAGAEMPTTDEMAALPESAEEIVAAQAAGGDALAGTPLGAQPEEKPPEKAELTPQQKRMNDLTSIIEMAQEHAKEVVKENKPTKAQRKLNNEFKLVKKLYDEAKAKAKEGESPDKMLIEVGGAIDDHYQKQVKDGVMSEKTKDERWEALVMLNYLFIMDDKNASPVSPK